jgi:hypothetical protein
MATQTMVTRNTQFKVGWIGLLVVSALAFLNHVTLAFAMVDEAVLFIGWAAYNLYSTVVLAIPFRRGEKWAWYTTWILVIGFASTILFSAQIGPYYLGGAILMAVGLLLARPAFFQKG